MKKEELDRLFDFLVENNTWCAIWSWAGNVDADKEWCYELIHPLHYKDDSLIETKTSFDTPTLLCNEALICCSASAKHTFDKIVDCSS